MLSVSMSLNECELDVSRNFEPISDRSVAVITRGRLWATWLGVLAFIICLSCLPAFAADNALRQGLLKFRTGLYLEAIPLLQDYLVTAPDDHPARYILIRASMKAGHAENALAQYRELQKYKGTTAADLYIAELRGELQPDVEKKMRDELIDRLSHLQADEALALVDNLSLQKHQKELIRFYINLDQAKFAGAVLNVSLLEKRTSNAAEVAIDLRKQVRDQASVVDPISWTKKRPFLRWWAALKIEESQCPKPERVTHRV